MNNSPMFSVITVCRNNYNGLVRTHESILSQNYSKYEWIVIDGASTDGSKEYLEGLPKESCSWISEPDNGLYDAMNKGIDCANGHYLLFLNSGDVLAAQDVLQMVASTITANKYPGFIYGDAYEEIQNQVYVLKRAYTHRMLWYGMFTHHQAMFFFMSSPKIKYSTDMRYASDYGYVAQNLKSVSSVCRITIPVCKFEAGGLSQSGSTVVANREQWAVRHSVMGYSYFTCAAIDIMHVLILMLKRRIPFVYKLIRFG